VDFGRKIRILKNLTTFLSFCEKPLETKINARFSEILLWCYDFLGKLT
jgi:hypothetical protein